MRKPNTPPEEPADGADFDAPCQLEDAKAEFLRRLKNGTARSVPLKQCRYIGVLTGRPCGTSIEVENSELIVTTNKLIPCLEQGEFTAIDENLPLAGPILEPPHIIDLDALDTPTEK